LEDLKERGRVYVSFTYMVRTVVAMFYILANAYVKRAQKIVASGLCTIAEGHDIIMLLHGPTLRPKLNKNC
jgi:hypothetical protein